MVFNQPALSKLNHFSKYPIADLHCDLLCYLAHDKQRTAYHPEVRCSIPQLIEGRVKVQVMAIFTETSPSSVEKGSAQMSMFKIMPKSYPKHFQFLQNNSQFTLIDVENRILILPAIENASSFCDEEENLEHALHRLTEWRHQIGLIAYISMTWNTENRFGGGAHTTTGLKKDGKRLIEYMAKYQIPLDLSHASDQLVDELLNYIDKKNLHLTVLASHSNLRDIANVPRNLPNDFVKEIIRRGGLLVLILYATLLG